MAGQVTADGQVHPPLNIKLPVPQVNLQGFKFGTVDQKILGAPTGPDAKVQTHDVNPQDALAQAAALLAQTSHVTGTFSQTMLPQRPLVPQTPSEAQLFKQLELDQGASVLPQFPLQHFSGGYAGNGFNMIFRPQSNSDKTPFPVPPQGPNDNILELNLTTEQLSFGKTIGDIPNRGSATQPDITLGGFPYLQTIQDRTNPDTGKADNLIPTNIHFETGMWLNVPETTAAPKNGATVVRMGSIPHGTTINAQSVDPTVLKNTLSGGASGGPQFDTLDTTPFSVGQPSQRFNGTFPSMDATRKDTFRIPQDLTKFIAAGTITTDIIKNPNLILQRAVQGLKINETISFQVSTGPPASSLSGGGTANISFLAGTQSPVTTSAPDKTANPNADAALMTAKYWIEIVEYQVNVPRLTTRAPVLLKPTMPANSTAPTPEFLITPPPKLPSEAKTITVLGVQVQSSQLVNLNFGPGGKILTWPHVSVSTLVPATPQTFTMT